MWVNSHSRTGLRHCNFQLQIFRCALQSDGLCKLHVGRTEPEEMGPAANAVHPCFFFFYFHGKCSWCFLQRNCHLMRMLQVLKMVVRYALLLFTQDFSQELVTGEKWEDEVRLYGRILMLSAWG